MQIAFLGLGQIGGSIARAASNAGLTTRVSAWSPTGVGPRAATADGIVAPATAADAIRGADLIVLAAPPLACLDLLDELAGPLAASVGPDAVITDVASTKAVIVDRARSHGLRFVGGHPMAGRETSGYGAADPDLFRERPWVIVAAEPADAVADGRVVELATACGARPQFLSAVEHDAAVAAISHLPLVLSATLVESMTASPDWPLAAELAATGWSGMTRLARGDPAMGAGILVTNGSATAERLRAFRSALDEWLDLLGDGAIDADAVRDRLGAVRDIAAGGSQPAARSERRGAGQ